MDDGLRRRERLLRPAAERGKHRRAGNSNLAYFDRPRFNREIKRINRLTGEVRRRAAWAALDVDMMSTDPPWAPFMTGVRRYFISESFGCYFVHPVIGLDLAAVCKK